VRVFCCLRIRQIVVDSPDELSDSHAMATPNTIHPLTRSELAFWRSAFLAAELTVLLKDDGDRLSPEGAAHLCADFAAAAIAEFRNARTGAQS
jgi:hypothetical protein